MKISTLLLTLAGSIGYSSLPSIQALSLPTPSGEVSRRIALENAAATLASTTAVLFGSPPLAQAASSSALTVPKNLPVLVLGASGKTGRECVSALLSTGRSCVATTRSGDFDDDIVGGGSAKLSIAAADVTSTKSLQNALTQRKLGAVIYAASASAKGGNAFAVDRDGVIETAKCCIAAGIPRLVVVSSGSVSRPDSAIYKLLNTVGKGIMEAKIQGEDTLRALYASQDVLDKNLGYTVIRPGGLTTGESLGPSALELNQGDSKSGRLSRADVAALCVQCLDSSDAFDTTFECYEALTAKSIEAVGFSNIVKSTDPTVFKSGKERQGDSWESLFKGLERDEGHGIA